MIRRRDFLAGSSAVLTGLALTSWSDSTSFSFTDLAKDEQGNSYAEGVVFHDRSGSGKREKGDEGIAGVCVSNGRDVVRTDREGKWRLPVRQDAVLFVIKPSGWKVPVNASKLPRYYYVHKPSGSPDFKFAGVNPTGDLPTSIEFPLQMQKEPDKFRMVLFGDPQPRNQTEIDYIAHDVVEHVAQEIKMFDPKFGLSLGDEMFDDLSLYNSLNKTIGTLGLPWYNTVGNHDLNYDSTDHVQATDTFKRVFGPPYYAFNYGKVHFIVLNNVYWEGSAAKSYHGELTPDQLEFIKNDLAYVAKDRLVFIAMHIPLPNVVNREELYRLIEDRPHTFSCSAHTHVQEHHFLDAKDGWKGKEPHHHLNHATVCGSWWEGAFDERGIPHATMSDGAPNGFSIVEFDDNRYKVSFRAASRPSSHQMNIWMPEEVASVDSGKTEITVNVYAGSVRSKVEMRVAESDWNPMANVADRDPYFVQLKELELGPKPPTGMKLPNPSKTKHLWKASLPAYLPVGTHAVEVRSTDMFGQVHFDRRILRVV